MAKKKVKKSKEEIDLIQARKDMDNAWVTLNRAITFYTLYPVSYTHLRAHET